MSRKLHPSRRCLLRAAVTTGAAAPFAGWMAAQPRPARAQVEDLPEAQDGHAQDYVSNAEDASGHPEYESGERCDGCVFWGEEVRDGLGTCNHPEFAEVLVAAEGWCAAYASLE